MPYIGRDTDKISNVEVLDNITFDGSSSYTLQKGGSNFTPSSANTLLLSIDGVVQAGNFTVSGSTIDFGTAVAGTSTCDFVLHYGVGLITAPSDGTVTTAKLADSSVSLAKLTATGTKDATTFLRGDNTFAEAGGGSIVQTKYLLETATYSAGSTSFVDLGSLSLSITPTSASNKILVHVSIGRATSSDNSTVFRFTRNGTVVGVGDTVGSRIQLSFGMLGENYSTDAHADNHSFTFIDEPNSTSALTYKLQQANEGGGTTYYNRTKAYTDSSLIQHGTAHTTFILQEIVA
jgi:hypothetical protein